ncbi:hypothetical protein E2C01_049581 [Portunus trituberculatus]|uniref:Uncharacterized protein n=1 Tax=Portunus trituberculatus TaxID=210409 RepID=A0A5B7GES5_PORTR|nr:hypothetical protein [Portunus trituberculatus]
MNNSFQCKLTELVWECRHLRARRSRPASIVAPKAIGCRTGKYPREYHHHHRPSHHRDGLHLSRHGAALWECVRVFLRHHITELNS